MMIKMTRCLSAKNWIAVLARIRLREGLLKSYCQFFKLFVSLIKLGLDLLQLSFKSSVFIFCNIVRDLQISVVVL